MTYTLLQAKPIFLKFIKNKTISDEEQDSLNQIKVRYAHYLTDIVVPDDEDPLPHIYLEYCRELIDLVEDAEGAEYAYDFIFELAEACKNPDLATHFNCAADEAFDAFSMP